MAASKDNLALSGIKTQSCSLCMSVILTLGVSLAGTTQGREEEEPYLTEGRRTRSLPVPPQLSHTCNYFPTAYTVSPSFLSAPRRDFGGARSRQYPRVPPEHTPRPGQERTHDCFPCKGHPRAAQHSALPYHSPEGNTQKCPPWWHVHPSQSQRRAKRRQQATLPNPPCPENPSPPGHRATGGALP